MTEDTIIYYDERGNEIARLEVPNITSDKLYKLDKIIFNKIKNCLPDINNSSFDFSTESIEQKLNKEELIIFTFIKIKYSFIKDTWEYEIIINDTKLDKIEQRVIKTKQRTYIDRDYGLRFYKQGQIIYEIVGLRSIEDFIETSKNKEKLDDFYKHIQVYGKRE